MTDSYRGGYKKALLDVMDLIETDVGVMDLYCKSKKHYKTAVVSLLKMLLSTPDELDDFMDGIREFKFNPKTKEFLPKKE